MIHHVSPIHSALQAKGKHRTTELITGQEKFSTMILEMFLLDQNGIASMFGLGIRVYISSPPNQSTTNHEYINEHAHNSERSCFDTLGGKREVKRTFRKKFPSNESMYTTSLRLSPQRIEHSALGAWEVVDAEGQPGLARVALSHV